MNLLKRLDELEVEEAGGGGGGGGEKEEEPFDVDGWGAGGLEVRRNEPLLNMLERAGRYY